MSTRSPRVVLTLLLAWPLLAVAATPEIHPGLTSTLELAATSDQMVLAIFASPGCGACRALEQDLMMGRIELPETVVVAWLSTERNREESTVFGITAIPDCFLLSAEGVILDRQTGYDQPQRLQQVMTEAGRRRNRNEWDGIARNVQLDESDPATLVDLLGAQDTELAAAAAIILHGQGATAVPLLFTGLRHPLLANRIGAATALRRLAVPLTPYDPWVTQAARHQQATTALAAWEAAVPATTPDDVLNPYDANRIAAALADFAAFDDPPRRSAAMTTLVRLDAAALPALDQAVATATAAGDERRLRLLQDVRWAILIPRSIEDAVGVRRILARGRGEERRQAVERIADHPAALPALRHLASDADPLTRELALGALQKIGSPAAVAAMAALCQAGDANSRMVAAAALGKTKQAVAAGQHLAAMVDDADEVVACTAIGAIMELKAKQQQQALEQALQDRRWRVRAAAADAIGKLSLKSATAPLTAALDDADAFVVRNVLEALRQIDHQPEPQRLFALIDRMPDLITPVAEVLAKQSPVDVPGIIALYRRCTADHRRQLLAGLRGSDRGHESFDEHKGDARWQGLWDLVLTEGDANQRMILIDLLPGQGVDLAAPNLERLLVDDNAQVVQGVIPLVARIVAWHWGIDENNSSHEAAPSFGIKFRALAPTQEPPQPQASLLERLMGAPRDEAKGPKPPSPILVARVTAWHRRWYELLAPLAAKADATPLLVLTAQCCGDTIDGTTILAALQRDGWYDALEEHRLVITLPRLLLRLLSDADRQPCFETLRREPRLVAHWLADCDDLPPGIQGFLLRPTVILDAIHQADVDNRATIAEALLGQGNVQNLMMATEQMTTLRKALATSDEPFARALAAFTAAETTGDVAGLADPDPRVGTAVFQGLRLSSRDLPATVEQAAIAALTDPQPAKATAAMLALIDPRLGRAANLRTGFAFDEVTAFVWRSSQYNSSDQVPLVRQSPPAWLEVLRRQRRERPVGEDPAWDQGVALLLAQYGDLSATTVLLPAWREDHDWLTTSLLKTITSMCDDEALLEVAQYVLTQADDHREIFEVLSLLARQTGPNARQLRREINFKLSGVKR